MQHIIFEKIWSHRNDANVFKDGHWNTYAYF